MVLSVKAEVGNLCISSSKVFNGFITITVTHTHHTLGHGHRPKRKIVSGNSSTDVKSSLQTEDGFLTDSRGRRLKTFTWVPSGPVRGLVFLSHGFVITPYLKLITINIFPDTLSILSLATQS